MLVEREDVYDVVHPDVAELLPYYEKLNTGDVEATLTEILKFASNGNKYASYLYASMLLFGRKPRYYSFNKSYPEGEVIRKAIIPIDQFKGVVHLTSMLQMKDGDINIFQLEAIYDLYKIIEGSAKFFTTNDVSCRPKTPDDQLNQLFSMKDRLCYLLVKAEHPEVFVDFAELKLAEFKNTESRESLEEAVRYLDQVLNENQAIRFSVFDVSRANHLMGNLYLNGNHYIQADEAKGKMLLLASRSDEALVDLIDYTIKNYGLQSEDVKRYIALIKDEALREEKYKTSEIEAPKPVELKQTISKLIGLKPKQKSSQNMSFDFADLSVESEVVAEPEPVLIQDDSILDTFEMIDDEPVAVSMSLDDGIEVDPEDDFEPPDDDVFDEDPFGD